MPAPPPPTAPPPPATPPPAGEAPADHGAPPPRRLTRTRSGRLVGGVAAGLARYLGVDPIVTRLGFVLLAFLPFPGFGVLVYLGMVLLVPEEDEDGVVTPAGPTERTPAFWLGVGLVALASFALLGVSSAARFDALVPLLLIGLGVALWVDADRRPGRGSAATTTGTTVPPVWAATATDPASTAGVRADEPVSPGPAGSPPAGAGGDGPPPVPPAPTGPAWTPPPVKRPSSPLGRVTLGLALLAGGVAWLVDLLDLATVPVASMLAVTLLVLGLGLLVGSVVGRARWLVAVVAVVLPVTLVAATIGDLGIDLRGGVDRRVVVVDEASELDQPLSIGAGELTIDLTEAPLADGMVLEARVGAGQLVVLVPEGTGLEGQVRVEVGETDLLGDRSGGVSVQRDLRVRPAEGAPTVSVDLRVGAGQITILEVFVEDADLEPDPGSEELDDPPPDPAATEDAAAPEDPAAGEDADDATTTTEEVQP
jgi:phage shock protein PspC (stress-responsive transcriptional regulator)